MRFALAALATAVVAFPGAAQPLPEAKGGKVTIPLTLSPGPALKPASRYMLQPQYTDLMPG